MESSIWGERLEDESGERGVLIAYRGKLIHVEALDLEPLIIYTDPDLSPDDLMGIRIIAKCGDVELARETHWGIGLNDIDPNTSPNREFLDEVLSSLAPFTVFQAYINMHEMSEQAEQTLKTLKEVRDKLSHVHLTHNDSKIKLTLGMAQQVLFIKMRDKARSSIRPFRLQRETESTAVIFDAQNRVMGRIGFDPTVEKYHHAEGRFGLYNLPD